jgi:ribosome assembly protein 4
MNAARAKAQERYDKTVQETGGVERLLSGSDDFTMFLWDPANTKKPITRMTGHQQLINQVGVGNRPLRMLRFYRSLKSIGY